MTSKAAAAPSLEYPLLFGLPENKTGILDGRMRAIWPYRTLDLTARAFDRWRGELARWRGAPGVSTGSSTELEIGGITLTRHRRWIEMQIPIEVDTLGALRGGFWEPELWDAPARREPRGYPRPWRHGDVRMNLWRVFREGSAREKGFHCYGDVVVAPDTSFFFDHYYYAPEEPMARIGDYPASPPRAVVQVLAPATREADRGPRLALLHRAGVRHVWLLDPDVETVEVFAWQPPGYELEAVYRPGDTIRPSFRPEVAVAVAELFDDQGERWGVPGSGPSAGAPQDDPPRETWLVDPRKRLGLEHLMLLGHPARRHEIWREISPCVLAFGSPNEARGRLRHFLDDAARWTGGSVPRTLELAGDVEAARLAGFQFTRRGNRVYLDVEVDPRVYTGMLEALCDRELWAEDDQPDS